MVENSDGDYVQAGTSVREFLINNKELRRRLGLADRSSYPPGKRLLNYSKITLSN
jgi:hypothetical protein